MIRGTNILHSWLFAVDQWPWGPDREGLYFTNAHIKCNCSPHKEHLLTCSCKAVQVTEETNEFSKEVHFILDVLNTSSLMPGGGRIGQFIILVRTRRQSNTSHAALRFKTLQDILHTCYIATFGVLTFIVPQGHKNVLPFIECTDSETSSSPLPTNPLVVERDLTIFDL